MNIGAELGLYAYILQTIKKFCRFDGGSLNAPLGSPMGLPKATARVDSRLKLTFVQLVSKSTHHV